MALGLVMELVRLAVMAEIIPGQRVHPRPAAGTVLDQAMEVAETIPGQRARLPQVADMARALVMEADQAAVVGPAAQDRLVVEDLVRVDPLMEAEPAPEGAEWVDPVPVVDRMAVDPEQADQAPEDLAAPVDLVDDLRTLSSP